MKVTKEQLEQALLERYTSEMYDKISKASVAIAGLGGLGSNVAVMLARAGVGHLMLVDFDIVELTNLNRQVYTCKHLGRKKTAALAEIIREINPYIELEIRDCVISHENVTELLKEYKIVCEAFDKAEMKAMLVNAVLEQLKETIVVSGSGMAGYGSGNTIRTEKIMKRLYVCGDRETELTSGSCLMAPRVTVCAAHQANMIIRLILGITEV